EFDVRHVFAASFVYDLPSVEQLGSLTGLIFGDWQFGGITMLRSGSPFTVGIQSNRSNTGHSAASEGIDRPNLRTGQDCRSIVLGTSSFRRAGLYFDPTAFELQPAGFIGNFGRNTCSGPGLATVDVNLAKRLRLNSLGAQGAIRFRVDVFNLFNHTNFSLPDRVVFAGVAPNEAPLTTAGRIRSTLTDSRQIQLGLRISF